MLESVKLISCWDLKEQDIIIIIIKNHKGNFNRIPTVLYLFAIINKISQIVPQQQLSGYGVEAVNTTGWCKLKVRARVETLSKHFSAMIFISVLLGLMDFSDIVMLHSRPNSCCQVF